ncbi:MAG TPA: LPS assembly lipoprotein LptE [Acetobacteraceae bacterium]|nr:LPS assembly lipoprotein LptE [Acetobacteraceae bacterium]
MKLGRRLVLGGMAAPVAAVVAGCGFRPVYMPSAGGQPGVAQRELAAIYVNLIPDRPGQLLRQALQQRFVGAGDSAKPLYNLNVVYWVSGEGIGVQPDNTTTRIRMFGNANWALVGRDPAQTRITDGSSRAEDAVNLINEQYFAADLQTEAAYRYLAEALADQITTRLATFFRTKANG